MVLVNDFMKLEVESYGLWRYQNVGISYTMFLWIRMKGFQNILVKAVLPGIIPEQWSLPCSEPCTSYNPCSFQMAKGRRQDSILWNHFTKPVDENGVEDYLKVREVFFSS